MRSRAPLAAALAAFLAISFSAEAARKRALLIGIKDYTASELETGEPAPPSARDWSNLDGAVNDVDLMQELLERSYGFRPADIVTLKNQEATRQGIVFMASAMIAATEKDDTVVFYYSGHGSQVRNSCSAEQDLLDESLVPADSRRGAPDIRDKELRDWFNQILDRGASLTVIIDACHSGSIGRGLDGATVRQVKPDLRDVADASTAPLPEDRGAIVLSAAKDLDPAFETKDDVMRGAFTWALVRALRNFDRDESVDETFARTQALLHTKHPGQNPVIGGLPAVRARAFLGKRIDRRGRRPVIAIEKAEADGSYIVQGGWMSGVTVGSELRFPERPDERLEVRELRGISRAIATRIEGTRSARLPEGELLEIANWAPPPARPLRVWIPQAGEGALRSARQLREAAATRGVRWIDDPIEATPDHVIRWRKDGWELAGGRSTARTATPLEGVAGGASVFVQVPATGSVVEAIGTVEGVELADGPENADYILAGRITGEEIEYAFLRPGVVAADAGKSPLPLRTAWRPQASPFALHDALARLQRVHAWHDLESPVETPSYYSLAICRTNDRIVVDDGILLGERMHHLVLRAKTAPPGGVFTRYLYVFVIDSAGAGVLLFPRPERGNVENRLPVTAEAGKPIPNPPEEIALESERFIVAPPYGADTYFLLSTDQPLLAISSLEWEGVRGSKDARGGSGAPPKSPLERLLAQKLTGTRGPGDEDIRISSNWSLEKVTFWSVEPDRSVEPQRSAP